jgi:hypothetical protein
VSLFWLSLFWGASVGMVAGFPAIRVAGSGQLDQVR